MTSGVNSHFWKIAYTKPEVFATLCCTCPFLHSHASFPVRGISIDKQRFLGLFLGADTTAAVFQERLKSYVGIPRYSESSSLFCLVKNTSNDELYDLLRWIGLQTQTSLFPDVDREFSAFVNDPVSKSRRLEQNKLYSALELD